MPAKGKKAAELGIAETILGKIDQIIPGLQGFFKKVEKSPVFGGRFSEIRKEIEKRFGAGKAK